MRYSGAVRIRVWSLGVLSCLAGCGTPGREVSPAGIASTLETEPVVRVASWGHPAAAAPGQLEAGLLEAELQRDPDHPAVEDGLSSADETSRRRAAHALGHIGGPTALRRLAALVDSDAGVAGVGAIAFLNPPRTTPGEPPVPEGPWAELEDALWSRYAVTEDVMDEEVQALLLAIARVGGPRSIERLAADAARAPVGGGHARYAGAMHAMALLCAGGHPLTETARDAVVQGLEAAHPQARKSAIYALGRCARSSAEVLGLANERGVITERLVPLLDRGGDEARLVWRAFAALGELPAEIPSGVLGPQPPGWQVEVEAVRALRGSAAGRKVLVERLTDVDPSQMAGARHHAFIEALRGLRDFVSADADAKALLGPLGTAIESARGGSSAHDQHALAVSACELQLLRSIAAGSLMPLEACGKQASISVSFADGLAIEALLHMGEAMDREARVNELLRRAADSRPSVAAPALAALADVEDARVNPALRSALDRLDVSLVSAAASAIAARSVDTSKRDPQAVEALIRTVRQLSNDEAVEARIVAIEALGSLGRTATPAIVESPSTDAPATPPSDWLVEVIMPLRADRNVAVRRAAREALLGHADLLRQFDGGVAAKGADFGSHLDAALTKMRDAGTIGLRFETTAGGFTLDFRGVPAPVNQANLVDLAGKGFYEGLRWHRVVPGFVVQGGDPHGDGYGGPGHVVPCEWSNVRYERGTVGIALAGKDTGGSQLFIAHSAQPHLDARYTIVGRVTDGMEVVDQLMPGDRIETVALLGADP